MLQICFYIANKIPCKMSKVALYTIIHLQTDVNSKVTNNKSTREMEQ